MAFGINVDILKKLCFYVLKMCYVKPGHFQIIETMGVYEGNPPPQSPYPLINLVISGLRPQLFSIYSLIIHSSMILFSQCSRKFILSFS